MTVEDEHEELVAELARLEKLSAEERLKAARKRRLSQLERWKKVKQTEDLFPPIQKANKGRPVKFEDSTTLIEASARNDAEEVERLIKQGISPDLQNLDGLSALHQAVIEDCEEVVHVLVAGGANLNVKDADFWTPLHAAVACGNYDLVKILGDNGADLVAINADGNMPIDLVDENEDIEVYLDNAMTEKGYTEEQLENIRNAVAEEMLLDLRESVQKGRDLDLKDETGATAMHVAAANGYIDVIEFLLDNGAKLDVTDKDGWQPVHAAACWGHDAVIEILFSHGADLDAKNNDNETPFDLTEDIELIEIMEELKNSGRKIQKSVKRTQSSSSRTLCVRRLSLVDKHLTSKNDAKSEGRFFQKPEVMNVMINAGEAEDDDEQKRNSIKLNSAETPEPPERQNTPSNSAKAGLFAAPLRPPSVSRQSVEYSSNEQASPAFIQVNEEKRNNGIKGDAPVDESKVSITITESKKDNATVPHLVSYRKIASPTADAPVAQPEVDSPMQKDAGGAQSLDKTAEANSKISSETRNDKNSAEAPNGKLAVRNDGTVHKKCCSIL
ncbi:protein phosphatase 1 regulatory inhibitor subunit 16B-like [Rhopilema esculentum]|uniref:protein phosphatase 1 regulatory inhibitor subunit 16B-like n=1 Tax=Rhopilema esculentum TaxID=499914 RepID=UPI0031E2BE68